MKKITTLSLLAALVASTSLATAAEMPTLRNYMSLEYNYSNGLKGADNDQVDSHGYSVTAGRFVLPNTAVELHGEFSRPEGTNSVNMGEIAATQYHPLVHNLTGYVRGALGERWGTKNDAYFSVEPGVMYAVTPAITASFGWRYRDTINGDKPFNTNTARVGGEYAFNSVSSVGVKYDRSYGDERSNGVSGGYTHHF